MMGWFREIYYPVEVAKYIVNKCTAEWHPISNFCLQFIMYETQLESFRHLKYPLIGGHFEAWTFGPVMPYAYYRFGTFGGMPIDLRFQDAGYVFEPGVKAVINKVLAHLGGLKPYELSKRKDWYMAWRETYQDGKGLKNIIDNKLIERDAKRTWL